MRLLCYTLQLGQTSQLLQLSLPVHLLDVLAPPYSPVTGRHCTYYHNVSRAVFAGAIFLACLSLFLMLNIVRETGMTSGIDSNGLG